MHVIKTLSTHWYKISLNLCKKVSQNDDEINETSPIDLF